MSGDGDAVAGVGRVTVAGGEPWYSTPAAGVGAVITFGRGDCMYRYGRQPANTTPDCMYLGE